MGGGLGDGWTAALRGDCERVEELLRCDDHSVDATHAVSGQTALHLACLQGHERVVGALLRKGAEADIKDAVLGETALHKAASRGHARIAQMLLSVGASKTARNRRGRTPMEIASRAGLGEQSLLLRVLGSSPADRARARGKIVVADLIESPRAGLEEAEVLGLVDAEGDKQRLALEKQQEHVEELRRLEKKFHVTAATLSKAERESAVHQESFENALLMLGNRELEIKALKDKATALSADLGKERKRARELGLAAKESSGLKFKGDRLAREQQSLERTLEAERKRRSEDKRLAERERGKLDDKIVQQQDAIHRLQRKFVEVATQHESHSAALETRLSSEGAAKDEQLLQLRHKLNESTVRVEDLLSKLEKETKARKAAEKDTKNARKKSARE